MRTTPRETQESQGRRTTNTKWELRLEQPYAHLVMSEQLLLVRSEVFPPREAVGHRIGIVATELNTAALNNMGHLDMPEAKKQTSENYWKPQKSKKGGWAPSRLVYCDFMYGAVGTAELEGFVEVVDFKFARQYRPKSKQRYRKPRGFLVAEREFVWFLRKPAATRILGPATVLSRRAA